jgi:hypothetical protein
MNTRILKLLKQASKLANTDDNKDIDRNFDMIVAEKFAELIVRECANLLMKPEYVMNHPEELTDYNRGWVNGRLLGIEHIKDHFGVEE